MHRCFFIIRSKEHHQSQQQQQPSSQWVEIIEPKSKEKMYANLDTGSCTWDPPDVSNLDIIIAIEITLKNF
jgi:hypothetical protein